MKPVITAAAAAAGLALTAAACSSTSSSAVRASVSPSHSSAQASSAQASASASPASSPASAGPVLAVKQAAATYLRIVDPANRAADATVSDAQDVVPLSQFRHDLRVFISATRQEMARLRTVRWPDSVQPYITAMLLTDLPAGIQCAQAQIAAKDYAAGQLSPPPTRRA
jgi:hypothetical protein